MMKKSIFKKLFCILSLVALLGFSSVPAYAAGAPDASSTITTPSANNIFLRAALSELTPEAGDTVKVTVSMSTIAGASADNFQVSMNGISSDVLYVVECKPLLSASTGIPSSAVALCYNLGDEVRFVYKGDEGISAYGETALMEVTLRINPNLATDGSIPLGLWYIKDNDTEGTFAGTVTIPYTVTAAGQGRYVYLNANGGTLSADALQTDSNGKLSFLPTPTREGYTFDGWYTAASGGEQVTTSTTFDESTVLYAHWTIDSTQADNSGSGMGDAVTLGVAGSIISVFVFLLILLVI